MPMPRRMLIAAVSTSRRNRLSPESAMSCSVSPKEMPETLRTPTTRPAARSEEHTSELQSRSDLVCRLLLEKKKKQCISAIRRTSHTTNHQLITGRVILVQIRIIEIFNQKIHESHTDTAHSAEDPHHQGVNL